MKEISKTTMQLMKTILGQDPNLDKDDVRTLMGTISKPQALAPKEVTEREAARLLGISITLLYRWRTSERKLRWLDSTGKQLHYRILPTGRVAYDLASVMEIIEAGKRTGPMQGREQGVGGNCNLPVRRRAATTPADQTEAAPAHAAA